MRSLFTILLLAAAPVLASDGEIRLLFDPNQCRGEIPCGESRTLFLYVELDGATSSGITGVEYAIQIGMDDAADPSWMFSETFSPGATASVGAGAFHPPDIAAYIPRQNRGRGVNVAWGSCQLGEDDLVLIETVTITNVGCTSGELRLITNAHDLPRNTFFRCPLAVLCDGPTFTKVCLGRNVTPCVNPEGPRGDPASCSTSGEAVINPASNSQSPCYVTAVEQATWSNVKAIFRR